MKNHIRVLGDVVHHVVGREAEAVLPVAPDVLGAPVPPFPAIRIADGLGEATRQFKKIHHDRVGSVDGLGLPVTVAVSEHA